MLFKNSSILAIIAVMLITLILPFNSANANTSYRSGNYLVIDVNGIKGNGSSTISYTQGEYSGTLSLAYTYDVPPVPGSPGGVDYSSSWWTTWDQSGGNISCSPTTLEGVTSTSYNCYYVMPATPDIPGYTEYYYSGQIKKWDPLPCPAGYTLLTRDSGVTFCQKQVLVNMNVDRNNDGSTDNSYIPDWDPSLSVDPEVTGGKLKTDTDLTVKVTNVGTNGKISTGESSFTPNISITNSGKQFNIPIPVADANIEAKVNTLLQTIKDSKTTTEIYFIKADNPDVAKFNATQVEAVYKNPSTLPSPYNTSNLDSIKYKDSTGNLINFPIVINQTTTKEQLDKIREYLTFTDSGSISFLVKVKNESSADGETKIYHNVFDMKLGLDSGWLPFSNNATNNINREAIKLFSNSKLKLSTDLSYSADYKSIKAETVTNAVGKSIVSGKDFVSVYDEKGNILAITENNSNIKTLQPNSTLTASSIDEMVYSVETIGDFFLIGTSNGLYVLDKDNKIIKQEPTDEALSNQIYDIKYSNGLVYIASKDGITAIKVEDNKYKIMAKTEGLTIDGSQVSMDSITDLGSAVAVTVTGGTSNNGTNAQANIFILGKK